MVTFKYFNGEYIVTAGGYQYKFDTSTEAIAFILSLGK